MSQLQNENAAMKQQVESFKSQVDLANKQLSDARSQFSLQLQDLLNQNRALQASLESVKQQDAALIDPMRSQNMLLMIGAAVLGIALIAAILLRRGTGDEGGRYRGRRL